MPSIRGPLASVSARAIPSLALLLLAACASHPSQQTSHASKGYKAPVTAIGVNGWLWRATLDTLAFMPLASADPYGGVVITDWYVNPEKPGERFKATVYILDTRLRADGLNVTVFKEVASPTGWVTAPTSPQTATDIENAILTRARQLRLSSNAKG